MLRVALLALCLFVAACSSPERKIYVDEGRSAPKGYVPPSAAYESWQRQEPVKEFYTAPPAQAQTRYVLVKPAPKPQQKEPNCKLLDTGLASWYGYELAGNHTANGEMFAPEGITAAHRTLPFGTIIKVTLDNGKGNPEGVYVRINDRGPFVRGRIIDLSLGAAKKLGMKDTQPVHVYACS